MSTEDPIAEQLAPPFPPTVMITWIVVVLGFIGVPVWFLSQSVSTIYPF